MISRAPGQLLRMITIPNTNTSFVESSILEQL